MMMRQVGLIPSGCHLGMKGGLYFTDRKIYYSSTLAVYVLSADNFNIENIVSINEKSISATSLSPHNSNHMAVAGLDGQVSLYDIAREEVLGRLAAVGAQQASYCKLLLAWDPHRPESCAIVISDSFHGSARLLLWEPLRGSAATAATELFNIKTNSDEKAAVLRWNPHTPGIMALGLVGGVIYVLSHNTKSSSQKKLDIYSLISPLLPEKERHVVVDLQWDRLSSVYLLAAYQSVVVLWDAERLEALNIFERQTINISTIAWMEWTSGNFITCNAKNGVAKVWNVSQTQPIDSVKLCDVGIHNICFESGSKRAVIACVDGSVIVYDMLKSIVEHTVCAGHTETIFDCAFSPASADTVATCSYDGSVKLWDVPNLQLTKTLLGAAQVIYSVDFSPDGKFLVASTVSGTLFVWDVESEIEIAQFTHHNKASYCVVWNRQFKNIICSTSADRTVVVFQAPISEISEAHAAVTGSRSRNKAVQQPSEILMRYLHPAPVFGCDWNHFHSRIFATCCQDGLVRVFDYSTGGSPLLSLEGHTARTFNCAWSPVTPSYLVSGSDDTTIIFWNISSIGATYDAKVVQSQPVTASQRLKGHTAFVRALRWSECIRNLLLSGSWDSTIRLWNVDTGVCLYSCMDHIADVYAIVSHPDNPFTFASCSRDTTLRIWEITETSDVMRMMAVWHGTVSVLDATYPNPNGADAVANNASFQSHMAHKFPLKLYGKSLKQLSSNIDKRFFDPLEPCNTLEKRIKMARNFFSIFRYFIGSSGALEIWNNLLALFIPDRDERIVNGGINRKLQYTRSEADVLYYSKSEARVLESNRLGGKRIENNAKLEEQLRRAALQFLQCGDIVKYCSLMIDVGDWTAALALAPAVSHEYWMELVQKYSAHLLSISSEAAVPYLIASNNDTGVVDFYLKRNQHRTAMVIAKMAENRTPPTSVAAAGSKANGELSLTSTVSADASRHFMIASKPLIAAAQYIATGEIRIACNILSACEYYDMAYAIQVCNNMDTNDTKLQMAIKCCTTDFFDDKASSCNGVGYIREAIEILSTCVDSEIEIGLLLSRFCDSEKDTQHYLEIAKCPSLHIWANRAHENAEMGSDSDAVIFYIISRQYEKAAQMAIRILKLYAREPLDMDAKTVVFMRRLKYLRSDQLTLPLRQQFLLYILWFSAHEAADLSLANTACDMLRLLEVQLGSGNTNFPISAHEVSLQFLLFKLTFGDSKIKALLQELTKKLQGSSELVSIVDNIKSKIEAYLSSNPDDKMMDKNSSQGVWGVHTQAIYRDLQRIGNALSLPSISRVHDKSSSKFIGYSEIITQGSRLPTANQLLKNQISCISGMKIRGPTVNLSPKTAQNLLASENEWLSWKRVNPYSPSLDGYMP